MLRGPQLLIAASVIDGAARGDEPVDTLLQRQFREHRSGSKDRARISAVVYGALRSYFPLRARLGQAATPLDLCAASALLGGARLPTLAELDATVIGKAIQGDLLEGLAPAARHNLPDPLWEKLAANYGEEEAAALAESLNQEASVDLRVNTLKASREQAVQLLAAEGITAVPTPRSDTGLRLNRRAPLQQTRAFREGIVEPQDEGSQLLAQFVAARPGEVVADFCAGAGGKTLALGASMQNRGEVHAFDTSAARLARLSPRLARSGLTIVQSHRLHDGSDSDLATFRDRFDVVLVDAPCSGTGTLRRHPEVRLRELDPAAQQERQLAILRHASSLVRPGGRLVYATCSVLREENGDVVKRFLSGESRFRLDEELVLLPHRDGTDGFYAGTLTKAMSP